MPKHVKTLKENRRKRILPFLVAALKAGQATAQEIGCGPVEALSLESEGLLVRAGTVQTGRRGRPAVQWRLSDSGRKRAKRALATA